MSLSQRGISAISQPLRADLDLFYEGMEDRYDEHDNPGGKFLLCIAENLLNWPEMEAKLREIAAGQIPEWVPSYTSILGAPPLREAAAGFLERHLSGVPLNPERLAIAAGDAAVIEMCAFLLGDPGDVVVIPSPAYMAYTPDIGNKANLKRYDLHHLAPATHPSTSVRASYYDLTIEDLDRAYAQLGDRFRVLLLTQPNNPTGQVYTPSQIGEFADWCINHKIHLVSNEIYALSLLNQDHEDIAADYSEQVVFTSLLRLLEEKQSDYLHWWYAISKDFGLSGLRMGMAYTHNEGLLQAWGNYGATSMTSNHTQWMIAEIFLDTNWTPKFIERNQQRLTESYAVVVRMLKRHKIPYAHALGSLFVWLDFSRFLRADTEEAELELWRDIYDHTGILLTSPVGMGSQERGWLRLVYSCVSTEALGVAMRRLEQWILTKRD